MAQKMDENGLKALVSAEIAAAINYDRSELSSKRENAIRYYNADMRDMPSDKGKSSAVSRDVADTIGWMLPGIVRVFTASDQFGVFEPVQPSDEKGAAQATDYCNYVFWKDNRGYKILYDGTFDSLLHGNGIGKIWWDQSEETEISEHSRLTVEQVVLLEQDEGVRILAVSENDDPDMVQVQNPETGEAEEQPVATYNLKIERTVSRGRLRIEIIAPENFLIDEDATCIEDARFSAHREEKTRSELIEMGLDREAVNDLPRFNTTSDSGEARARREGYSGQDDSNERSMDLIEIYECYIRADIDGDGVAENLRVYYAGDNDAGDILDWEICETEHPFFDVPCTPIPHRWDASSIADETMDVQRIKTALTRQALDNIYASNLPQPEIEEGSVLNMDALLNPEFGKPIIRKKGSPPTNWQEVPFVAGDAFNVINYFDQVIEKRTGVSRSTMALDPEALQNQTATAVQAGKDSAYSQIELIARNQAELGWRVMFRKMLRLIVKHQDRPRTIRLRDQWVEIDPRHWNASMDVTINVGLGTGSRDRDMMMLQQVAGAQEKLVSYFATSGMQAEAIQMVPKIINTLRKIAESAGIKSVESYFPDIDEEWAAQKLQDMQSAEPPPDPEMQKAMAKIEADQQASMARLQLDMQKSQTDIQAKAQDMQMQMELKREQLSAELELKREQLAAELQLKREMMAAELQLKREIGAFSMPSGIGTSSVNLGGEPG